MGLFRTIPLQLPPFSGTTPKSIIQTVTENGLLTPFYYMYLWVSTRIERLFLLMIDSLSRKRWVCLGLFPYNCHLFLIIRLNQSFKLLPRKGFSVFIYVYLRVLTRIERSSLPGARFLLRESRYLALGA